MGSTMDIRLTDRLVPERILLEPAADKQSIPARLIDVLVSSTHVHSADDLRRAIFHRESLMSTRIGMGLGIPYARIGTVDDLTVAAAFVADGVPGLRNARYRACRSHLHDGGASLGDVIVSGITATTLIVQLLGRPLVTRAVRRAGENDRRMSEEDILAELSLHDVLTRNMPTLWEDMPLAVAIDSFSESNSDVLLVSDTVGACLQPPEKSP